MKRWHLSEQNLPFLIEHLKEHLQNKKDIVITIEENKEKRTAEQNDRLWHLYTSIGNHLGYTPDEMHTLMRFKFLRSAREKDGEVIEVIKSTTKLSVKDMSDYQTSIEIWAGQLGWSDEKR